jgi:hypothetical protein
MWLLAGMVITSGFAHAQIAPAQPPAPDPYAVSIPVAGQTPADLQRAAALGLRELLARLSGRSDIDTNAALNTAAASADCYLEQYRYERNPAPTPGATPWLAQLRFNPTAVNQLLRNSGLSGGAESAVLRVTGIENFDDYAALLNYLTRLTPVKGANPVQVFNDEVTLQLKLQGSIDQLVRQFALDNRLTPTAPSEVAPPTSALQYRWSRG